MELRKMTADEYKQVITDMLRDVHDLCQKHNIRYCVAYGTLIGAIRHSGLIPWDDDIDIWMDAADYERFVKILSEEYPEDYYTLSPENSPYYYNLMCRICSRKGVCTLKGSIAFDDLGPFIDVFQVHKAPEDPKERQAFFDELNQVSLNIRYCLPLRYYKTLPGKRWSRIVLNVPRQLRSRAAGLKKLKERRAALASRYDGSDSKYYYAVGELKNSDRKLFKEDIFDAPILHRFEGFEVFIPRDYDSILTRLYGDYMTPPPVEKRVTRHHFTPYWSE